jgi:hypothetical protein
VGYFDFAADLKLAIASRVAEMSAPTRKRNPAARNNWPFNVCLVNRNTIIFAMNGTHKIAKKAPTRPNLDSLMTDIRTEFVESRTFRSYGNRSQKALRRSF